MTKKELKKYTVEFMNNETGSNRSNINSVMGKMLIKYAEVFQKRITELEAQIKKMKCCYNCKYSRTDYEHCITNKHEKWEMKEK